MPAVQIHRQPGQHAFQVNPRLVPVELGRPHQLRDRGGALIRHLAVLEQPVLRPSAHCRLRFSQRLLSIGTLPSFRKRVDLRWHGGTLTVFDLRDVTVVCLQVGREVAYLSTVLWPGSAMANSKRRTFR